MRLASMLAGSPLLRGPRPLVLGVGDEAQEVDGLGWGVLADDEPVAAAEGVGRQRRPRPRPRGTGTNRCSHGRSASGVDQPAWFLKAPSAHWPIRSIAAPWLAIVPDSPSGASQPGGEEAVLERVHRHELLDLLAGLDDGGDAEVVVGGDLVHRVGAAEADHQIRVPEVRRPLVTGPDGDRVIPASCKRLDVGEQLGPRRRGRFDAGLGEEVLVVPEPDHAGVVGHAVLHAVDVEQPGGAGAEVAEEVRRMRR